MPIYFYSELLSAVNATTHHQKLVQVSSADFTGRFAFSDSAFCNFEVISYKETAAFFFLYIFNVNKSMLLLLTAHQRVHIDNGLFKQFAC